MQRRARLRSWLVGLAAWLAWAIASATGPPWMAEPKFSVVGAGAIPRGVVAAVVQDRSGFLWIATGDGLVRHDGYRFSPRGRDAASGTQRNLGWVRSMLSGRDGRLWIGSESDGLAVYDPASDRITLFGDASPESSVSLPGAPRSDPVRALAEGPDGSVWVGTLGGGLTRLDVATGQRSVWRRDGLPGSLPDDRILALCIDRHGTVWVGTWAGLVKLVRGSDQFQPVLAAPGQPLAGRIVQALFEASDGQIWVGTQRGELMRLDPAGGRAQQLAAAGGAVNSLAEAPQGQVWVGRSTGIDLHAVAGPLSRSVLSRGHQPGSLGDGEVIALHVDQAGVVWVGGIGIGLRRHDPSDQGIRVRAADPQPDSPLATASARSLLMRSDGQLWVALQNGGVAVLDSQLNTLGRVPLPPQAAAAGVRVHAMAQAADGTTWLATGNHLVQLDSGRRALRVLPHSAGEVYRLVLSRDSRLWLCTDGGLYLLAPGDDGLRRVGSPTSVFAIAQAPDGSLWLGGTRGLQRLPAGSEQPVPVPLAAGADLGGAPVVDLLFDTSGRLWIDTAISGLHRLQAGQNGAADRIERISERLGVVGRHFGANLIADAQGRIWSQQYVYDPASDHLHELTEADGKRFGTGWFHSHARLPDGRLVFGGSLGLLVVQPQRFAPSQFAPPVVVSALRVNGLPQPAPPALAAITQGPGNRSFSLEFAALDHSDPARVRYAYLLEGFDTDWVATTADQRTASYGKLPPGDYVLRVRATNRSGLWSAHELAVAVQVLPAWWQRPAVKVAAALCLMLGVWALVQLRTRSLRAQRRALEREVSARTAELEASSLTDPLTGLHNRRFLAQQLPLDIADTLRRHDSHRRLGSPATDHGLDLVFFLIDIDHFKQINDDFGHHAGDTVLVQMRVRLQQAFRQGDHLVRWGGEEFLIVARNTAREQAAELAERVRAAVAGAPFRLDDGREVSRSCSVGFAAFPLAPQHPLALDGATVIDLADAALFVAKRQGRNGWMGLLRAHADSAQTLREQARQPLLDWAASGALVTVRSASPDAVAGPAELLATG